MNLACIFGHEYFETAHVYYKTGSEKYYRKWLIQECVECGKIREQPTFHILTEYEYQQNRYSPGSE